jgi:predicted alpha/beta-hydrolase family hydrolase
MTSQAQAEAPLPAVHGLAFLGFPLHPAGRPSQDRGKHLFDVQIPMLFLQGTVRRVRNPKKRLRPS